MLHQLVGSSLGAPAGPPCTHQPSAACVALRCSRALQPFFALFLVPRAIKAQPLFCLPHRPQLSISDFVLASPTPDAISPPGRPRHSFAAAGLCSLHSLPCVYRVTALLASVGLVQLESVVQVPVFCCPLLNTMCLALEDTGSVLLTVLPFSLLK